MRLLVAIIFFITSLTATGQVNTSVNLSQKHKQQLTRMKSSGEKVRMLRVFMKRDSTKQAKAERRQVLKESRRLSKHVAVNDKYSRRVKEGMETTAVLKDTANRRKNSLKTVSTEANKHFGRTREMKEVNKIKSEVEDYTVDVTEIGKTAKELKDVDKLGNRIEDQMVDHTNLADIRDQQTEFEALKDTPAKYEEGVAMIKDPSQLRDEMIKKAKSNAMGILTKNSQALTQAQSKLAKLKKKYVSVPNSRDLSTATKRNSLKGEPLKDRFYLTGNFQILNTEPFSLDGVLSIGYKFNKDFLIGINGLYRRTFGHYQITYPHASENVAGFGLFTSYQLKKGFFWLW